MDRKERSKPGKAPRKKGRYTRAEREKRKLPSQKYRQPGHDDQA